ncbi:hypothetical protein SAMN06264365_103407 [Actinoplanes regularis]|uniref:Uncharacterized protein n=1 Tax=Actinoplanes regularis TaxID=52697 RepID=A0A238XG90_9ACTN|nr:hypothetical protein Are01nite_32580 [Actinoplanes regularis]SNR57730.1 hypothetical protein SAMN06264365_103407 [Actinoplanes regularis]
MSRVSGACDPEDDPPTFAVISRQDGPDGRPGDLIWIDTGSGPGREVWIPDPETPSKGR